MAGLHFDITGDNSNFLHKLEETRNGVRTTSKQIEESGMSIEQMFGRMTTAAAAFGISLGAKQLISDITRVRGEFQQLEVAFNTMLGSKEQANTLMSQLVYTAAKTPFDLQGVANGAKQLLAYGTATEDVNETLIRLGDIASGLSIPLNDLVWLYGTTMTQGRLFTQDLRQFMGRGIPLADELAKQFGVTKDKVGELVTAGKVGFPEVQKVIEAMTDKGGKFGGLMEEQSKTITGQISNIEDAISTMFNKIGKENESIINSGLSGVSYLVEHWEAVVTAIESAAVAYGTYKAAVMTAAALHGVEQTLKVDTEIDGLKTLLEVKKQSNNADIAAAVASGKLTESKAAELTMLREELALKISSLETEKGLAEKAYANALLNFNTAEKRLQTAQDAVDGMDDWIARAENLGNTELANTYRTELAEKSVELQSAAIARNSAQKALNDAATKKKSASEALNTVTTQANTVANHANTASMNIMKLAAIQLTNILNGMWATLMANPLLLVAGAVAGLGFALYKVATAESEAETATRMHNKAIDEQQKKQNEYKDNIDKLIKAIEDNNRSEGERLQAFEALKAEYPTILDSLLTEAEYLKEIAKYKKLIAGEDNNRARQSDVEILEEEKRKLKYFQDVRRKGTSTTLVDMDGNGWATDNVDDAIKAQQAIVNKAIAKVASHDVTSFLGNIQNMKDNDIASVINAINLSLKAIGKNGDDAIAIVAELGGEFSKAQLSTIKNALETEQASRSSEKNTGKEWIEKYKNNYLNAKKELDNFLNTENELTEFEYEKKLKELTEKKDEAEKKYKSVGGVTGSKADKQQGDRLKQQEQLAEQLLSLRRKNQQDEISLMADGTEKKLAQIDLDYQKELDAIKKQRKDWETAQGGKLTDKQEAELGTWASNAAKKRESDIDSTSKAKLEADKKAWQEYFIEFGNYQEKRKNLIQKYDDEIAKLQTDSPEYAIKVAEKNQAVEQLDEQYGRTTRAMADLFEDASNKSVSAIQEIINKYETLIKYMSGTDKDISIANLKGIGFTDKDIEKIEKGEISIKDVTDAIRGLKDELKGKSPWQAFVSDLEKGIEAIKKGGNDSKKVGQGITDIGNAVTSFTPALGEFGSNIANIFGVSDSAITGVTDALGGLGTTAAGVGQIMSGDIVGGAMSAVSGISSVVSAFEGLFGADYSDYENMKAQYETLIAIWDELITKKMDYIDIDYGTEAIKAAEEAEQLVNIQISRQRQLIKQLASSGASAGSHSLGYRINDRLSKEDYQRISGLVGQKITAEYQLWDLSTEQIEKILSDEKLVSVLDTVNKDFVTYLQNIVDYGEQLTEIAQKEKEAITGIGFDEFKNGYADLLSDLDSTNEDFANNFEKYLRKAIFQSLIANKYKNKIKELYDAWANYGKDGLSSDEAREIRDMQAQLTDSLLAEREQLMKDFGWSPSTEQQTASSKGFQTMSQDTGEELNGRFTALQISNEEIKNTMLSMLTIANTISISVNNNGIILAEIRNLVITSNDYLDNIAVYTKKILEEFGSKLDNINQNIAKAL
jgi:tape measure domain-containing protein